MYIGSIILISDNSGARTAKCLRFFKKTFFPMIGDIVVVSLRAVIASKKLKKKEVHKCVIIRSSVCAKRFDGCRLYFDAYAAVLLGAKDLPLGTRVFGVVGKELRDKSFFKIASLAAGVI